MASKFLIPWRFSNGFIHYMKSWSKNDNSRNVGTTAASQRETRKSFTTVDINEVDKHTKFMEQWWNPNGPVRALHTMNLIRIPLVRDGLVNEPYKQRSCTPLLKKKILDVGCGGGILSEPLARLGADVMGIDASRELVECAQRHSFLDKEFENRPTYCHTTIEEHAEKFQNYYDAVVASEIIEHITEKELFIKACVQTLKPNGKIFFTTPNRTKMSKIAGIYLAENVFSLVPRGTHEFDKFITPTELSFLLERNNCHVELIHGLFYSILSNRWSFIESQVLMYALQAVKHDKSDTKQNKRK